MAEHGEKFFSIAENQDIWDAYYYGNLDSWNKENRKELEERTYTEEEREKELKSLSGYKNKERITPYKAAFIRKKQSLQQYKPIVLEFEEFVGKSFNEITAEDMTNFLAVTKKKEKQNHFYSFFRECVTTGIIKNRDRKFILGLIPNDYRAIGEMLALGETNEGIETEGISIPSRKIRCPYCKRMKEAVSNEWLLFQREGETVKYLACRECGGKDEKESY